MAEFEEIYDEMPGGEVDETVIEPPRGYRPLGAKERSDWNNFLRYVRKEKNLTGSKELDDRTAETGLKLLDEYRKDHPDFTISRETVPFVQYEMQQLKNTGELPNLKPEGRVRALLGPHFKDREVSPVDGWIGSITSRNGYPEIQPFSEDPEKRNWGTDYAGANEFERSKASR
jgi:hypothetical protein